MKILKNGTYRGLLADQHNLGLLADKHKRLEVELNETKSERDHLKTELKKYRRQRGSGGRFMKK